MIIKFSSWVDLNEVSYICFHQKKLTTNYRQFPSISLYWTESNLYKTKILLVKWWLLLNMVIIECDLIDKNRLIVTESWPIRGRIWWRKFHQVLAADSRNQQDRAFTPVYQLSCLSCARGESPLHIWKERTITFFLAYHQTMADTLSKWGMAWRE